MKARTITQQRAKINGFISEYEKRLKGYADKYGTQSDNYRVRLAGISTKINLWREDLRNMEKPQAKYDRCNEVVRLAVEYYGGPINISKLPFCTAYPEEVLFIAKYIVEEIGPGSRVKVGGLYRQSWAGRRDYVTDAMGKDPIIRRRYKVFKQYINKHLCTTN